MVELDGRYERMVGVPLRHCISGVVLAVDLADAVDNFFVDVFLAAINDFWHRACCGVH